MRSFDNMIVFRVLFVAASCGGLASCAPIPATNGSASPREQVFATERAFAATMAHRDLAAFGGFIDDEAVFLGGAEPLRYPGEYSHRRHLSLHVDSSHRRILFRRERYRDR